jgi:hypothetical protein
MESQAVATAVIATVFVPIVFGITWAMGMNGVLSFIMSLGAAGVFIGNAGSISSLLFEGPPLPGSGGAIGWADAASGASTEAIAAGSVIAIMVTIAFGIAMAMGLGGSDGPSARVVSGSAVGPAPAKVRSTAKRTPPTDCAYCGRPLAQCGCGAGVAAKRKPGRDTGPDSFVPTMTVSADSYSGHGSDSCGDGGGGGD